MQSFLRLTRRTSTARDVASFLTACTTLPVPASPSQSESDPQRDHSKSDPKPPSLGHNLLTWRIERLLPGESVVGAFQGWMRDGFEVDRGAIYQTVNCLRRCQLYSRALEVMEWVMRERPYKVKELDYYYLLEFTSKCLGIAHVEKLLLTIPGSYHDGLLNRLVMSCFGEHRVEHSYTYMKKLRELSLPISADVYHRLITLHLAPSRRKTIPDILTQMKDNGVRPHTSTFNVLLDMHANNHDIDELSRVFDEMQRANVEPNEITYCILAKAYAMARLYTVAETYVEAIERSKTGNNCGSLDVLIMLYGCLNKDRELDRTWKLVQQLPHVPSRSYLLAIEAFGKIRSVSSAEEIWAKFRSSKEINLTNEFNSILSVYCRYGIIEKATEICNEMASNKCKPNAITYRHLALGYLKVGRVKDAVNMIRMGKREPLTNNVMRSRPWLETTLMVVEMFGRVGYLEEAELVFKELKKAKYIRHTFVYNALFKGYVTAKIYLPDLLERMISDGAEPDAESHSLLKLIEQFKRSY